MADQAKEKPQQPAQRDEPQVATAPSPSSAIAGAGAPPAPESVPRQQTAQRATSETGNPPRAIQEAVPLPSVESDPLTEAARHFRELQAKSAGVTPMPIVTRAAQPGDVARDLLKDDGQISSLALSATAEGGRKPDAALPADMLADGDNARARATPRPRPRIVKTPDSFIDVEARPLDSQPVSSTLVDMDPDLALPPTPSPVTPAPSPVAEASASNPRSDSDVSDAKPDEMNRVLALAAQAPILVAEPMAAPVEASSSEAPPPNTLASKLPPFPAIERERRLPSGPSGNLRLFAGLSIVIAAFAGSLVWVAMWRADSFSSTEATLEISPEKMIQTSAGGNTEATLASTDNGGTATASLLVRDTELLLAKLAFDPGPTDGVLDDTTREAIRRYQQAAGLPQTGEPSKELLEELQAVAAAIDGN